MKTPKAIITEEPQQQMCDFCHSQTLCLQLFQKAFAGMKENQLMFVCNRCCENLLAVFADYFSRKSDEALSAILKK